MHGKIDKSLSAKIFLDFTRKWVELVNRGGLIEVKDEFYIFIRRIEVVIRKILTIKFLKQYTNEDLRDILLVEIEQATFLKDCWQRLSKNLESIELSNYLYSQIIEKWIDIRAQAFVNAYIQLVKRAANKKKIETKASKKAEPALRKTLS